MSKWGNPQQVLDIPHHQTMFRTPFSNIQINVTQKVYIFSRNVWYQNDCGNASVHAVRSLLRILRIYLEECENYLTNIRIFCENEFMGVLFFS